MYPRHFNLPGSLKLLALGSGRWFSEMQKQEVMLEAARRLAPVNPRNSPYGAIEITYVGIGDGEHVQPS
jgi:hypothetical protein